MNGHVEIARMLAGEFNANIDMQNTVKRMSISYLCDVVLTCRVGVVVNVVVVANIVALLVSIYATTLSIAPLHLFVKDAICNVNVFMVVVVVVVDGVEHVGVLYVYVVGLMCYCCMLYGGRMEIRRLCLLAWMVKSTWLACWRANSTPTSI